MTIKVKYKEILELYEYCKKLSLPATLERMFDGFTIRFPNGEDFIQFKGSYGYDRGCVEPGIGCRLDYSAVPLKKAKALVKYHKERLCRNDRT